MIFKLIGIFCVLSGFISFLLRKWIITNKNIWFLYPKDEDDNKKTEKIMNINIIFTGIFLIIGGLIIYIFPPK